MPTKKRGPNPERDEPIALDLDDFMAPEESPNAGHANVGRRGARTTDPEPSPIAKERVKEFYGFLERYGLSDTDAKAIWKQLVSQLKAGEKWAFDQLDRMDRQMAEAKIKGNLHKPTLIEVDLAREALLELADRLEREADDGN